MPLVHFAHKPSQVPADAQNVRCSHEGAGYTSFDFDAPQTRLEMQGPTILMLWDTHIGLCLREYERNGYNDSDFYMVVWDPVAEKPETIMFATTRGWSYPCLGSRVDATPEVRAAYDAWCKRRDEENKAARQAALDAKNAEIAKSLGVSVERVEQYRRISSPQEFETVIHLATAKLRNKFRISLQQQILAWFRGEKSYDRPLSQKQLSVLDI